MASKTPGVSSVARAHKTANAVRHAKNKTTHENPLLPHKTLRQMNSLLLAARKLESSAAPLLRKHKAAGITGNEATLVSLVVHLQPQDKISAASGSTMLRLLRGAKPASLLRELRGKSPRITEAEGILPLLTSGRIAAALGVALAAKSAQSEDAEKNAIVLAYLEPADLTGSWLEVIQAAGRLELPIVFLILDDPKLTAQARARQWQQLREATLLKGGVELIPTIPVDGQDVVAMYRAAQESTLRARSAIGPTVLWCERWSLGRGRRDAFAGFQQYLASKGLLPARHKLS